MEKIKTVPRDNSGKSNKSNKFRKVKTKEPKITRVSKTRLLIFEIIIIVLILVLVFRVKPPLFLGWFYFIFDEFFLCPLLELLYFLCRILVSKFLEPLDLLMLAGNLPYKYF